MTDWFIIFREYRISIYFSIKDWICWRGKIINSLWLVLSVEWWLISKCIHYIYFYAARYCIIIENNGRSVKNMWKIREIENRNPFLKACCFGTCWKMKELLKGVRGWDDGRMGVIQDPWSSSYCRVWNECGWDRKCTQPNDVTLIPDISIGDKTPHYWNFNKPSLNVQQISAEIHFQTLTQLTNGICHCAINIYHDSHYTHSNNRSNKSNKYSL